jgi:hypothetical protein
MVGFTPLDLARTKCALFLAVFERAETSPDPEAETVTVKGYSTALSE